MHTVKSAAALTGIAPDTLRAWERRYGVIEPERSAGGYRLYDENALRRLAIMKSLVDIGVSPAQAARRVLESATDGVGPRVRPQEPSATTGADDLALDIEGLARAAEEMDGEELLRTLDTGFAVGSFEFAVEHWLMPSLARLGEAWREGRVGIAGEHFVSAAVQRRLSALFDAAGRRCGAPAVLAGLGPGSRHELGILAFATTLRRTGTSTTYVGADLPVESWMATVRSQRPAAVALGVSAPEDAAAVRRVVDAVVATDAGVPVFVGGAFQDRVGGACEPLGHSIVEAASRVAQVVRDAGAAREDRA